jgi:hypothetical protein
MYSYEDDDDDKKYAELLQSEIQILKETVQTNDRESDMIEIYDKFYSGNSPLSMSSNNSDIDENYDNSVENEFVIDKQITDNFSSNKNYSNELDMLITYIRGYKTAYLYANYVMRSRFNCLTMTSILFTASMSIFTPFIGAYTWSTGLIVILNALTTMMISIVKQLQLESSADHFYNSAIQYENIEIALEYRNNIIVFMEDEMQKKETIMKKITDIESELIKIKESDKIEIPGIIKYEFPLIMHLNVFSFIKKMHVVKKSLIEKLMIAKKEAKYILRKRSYNKTIHSREAKRLKYLVELKQSIKTDLNYCINAYDYMNDLITREISIIDFRRYWYRWVHSFVGEPQKKYCNPIVDDYIKFITQP